MKSSFPFYRQPDSKDCGPTCLRIIAKHYDKLISLRKIREIAETTRGGSNLLKLAEAAEHIGFKSLGVRISFRKLKEAPLPLIVHWDKNHFVVIYKITNKKIYISDPAYGLINYNKVDFISHWIGNNATEFTSEGITLLLEVTQKFKEMEWKEIDKTSFLFLYKYLFKYKQLLVQLTIGLAVGSLLQLIVPFVTQSIVDIGIRNQDINFIYLLLIAQLFLFVGRTSVEIFRSWILLHLSTRINISLVSDFFIKLMNLPIAFFDTRMTGDIMQRIGDHGRIQNLLTNTTLSTLFSLFNLVLFSFVLVYYNLSIFLIFLTGSILYIGWVFFFLKRRRELDHERFKQMGKEKSTVIELITGMQEIKLNNAERQKRWQWEFVQAKLFKISIKSLALEQTQSVGSSMINELKNIFITFTSALLVIEGSITLGMMLSIQYIIGSLNGPITQFTGFIQSVQDAKISLERLGEIHDKKDEENNDQYIISKLNFEHDIKLEKVIFRYLGNDTNVLQGITINFPVNKTTAIVGASGSGKTTIMKILLKFYDPNEGQLTYGPHNLQDISQKEWRANCGVVMQEGYVFNDTIANNIAVGDDSIEYDKLVNSCKIANIYEYIQGLPTGFNTKIGNEGMGMSTGQKQRLFIARAIYKNPKILFFDEATSALDAKNERIIMENLNDFFKQKTAIIIAHRLSTVKNADQIVVMGEGQIKEIGNHESLLAEKGIYFDLVKNQLALEKIKP
mgnify:CR=1 FL=1